MTVPLHRDDDADQSNGIGTVTKTTPAYGPKQTAAIELSSQLADLIAQEPHRFALDGDDQLTTSCIAALKGVFDFAVDTENAAIPAIAATLRSALPSDEDDGLQQTTTRKRKRKSDDAQQQTIAAAAHPLFEQTPVSELTIEGMKSAQLWEQLELRSSKVCKLLDTVIVTEGEAEEDDEDETEEDVEPLDDAERKLRVKRAKEDAEEETVHSLEQLSDSELRALGIDPSQRSELEALAMNSDSEGDEDDEEEDEEEGMYGYPGASDLSDDDEYSGIIVKEPLLSEEEQQKRKAHAEAEERRQIMQQRRLARMMRRFDPEGAQGSDDDEEEDDEQDEDEDLEEDDGDYDEDEDEEESDEADDEQNAYLSSLLDDELGPSPSSSGKGSKTSANVSRHAELDDNFFSIDQFNRDTDDYGDEGIDLGDEVDLFKSIDGGEEDEEEDESAIHYADFFAPPPFQAPPSQTKGSEAGVKKTATKETKLKSRSSSVRFNDEVSIRHIKARRPKGGMQISPELLQLLQADNEEDEASGDDDASLEEEEEGDEDEVEMETDENFGEDDDPTLVDDEEEESGEEQDTEDDEEGSDEAASSDADREVATRVAGDLFDDEENDDAVNGDVSNKASSHQRRLLALQQEIVQLERENVGKKDWTLMGEAGSRVRPENSLLEEDVEFESNRKAKPANTPETTQSIEDMIKKRILDDQFDDVQRRATLNPLDFLPSKMLELSDQKSSRSLGDLYEDDVTGAEGQGSKLDKELQKEHEEIDRLYGQLEAQLDALSNAHYTPKAPEVTVQTLSNTPSITLEESLPSSMSHGSRLAPEEVYDAGTHNVSLEGASSELTPEEKRRRHRQLRDEKRSRNERIAAHRQNVEINRQAFGQNRGGRFVGAGQRQSNGNAAAEKDEALRKLMGNKGVSIVGKSSSSRANGAKGQQGSSKGGSDNSKSAVNAATLKL